MIVNKAHCYVYDVLKALDERKDPKDERLRAYLSKACVLLSEEVWMQLLELWKSGMDEERIGDKIGFSICDHPDYSRLPGRKPGKQTLHLVRNSGGVA